MKYLLPVLILAALVGLLVPTPEPSGASPHHKAARSRTKARAAARTTAIQHVKVSVVFLGSGWKNSSWPSRIKSLTQGIVTSDYMDMLGRAGYGVGQGTVEAQVSLPANLGARVSDGDIRTTLANNLGGKLKPFDARRLYIFFVQPGVVITATFNGTPFSSAVGTPRAQQMTGYHDHAPIKGNSVSYAVIAFPGGVNLGPKSPDSAVRDELSEITSHEIAEAVVGQEIADKFNGVYVRMSNGIAVQTVADKAGKPLNPKGSTPISAMAKRRKRSAARRAR
jgi:hypothetical protein